MVWLVEIVWVAAILMGSAALCVAAIFAAHKLHLNRFWSRLAASQRSPDQVISELGALADVAVKQGVLGIEGAAAASTLPLLQAGIALAIAGSPAAQVRQDLGDVLDRSVLRTRWIRRASLWISVTLLLISILFMAALQVVVAAAVASSTVLAGIPASLFAVAFIVALGLACLPTLRDWASQPDTGRLLIGTLVIEGVCLIGSGKDGRTVSTQLHRLLPRQDVASEAAVAA